MSDGSVSFPAFAETDEHAQERYERFKSKDPFPGIDAALLNTADLLDYVAATGMVHPFAVTAHNFEEKLKPASCAIPCGGELLYWEDEYDERSGKRSTKQVRQTLHDDEIFMLKPNSIVYVRLAPTFRIPDYIAARFNLTIRDIHRGLLVGTGPLVDPGFVGRLTVPLHNLTANEYPIRVGEPLVWMEFTKLSSNERWSNTSAESRTGTYVSFPDYKLKRKTLIDYVSRANRGPITSSIPRLVGEARSAARASATDAGRVRNLSLAAAVAVILGVGALVLDTHGFIADADRDRAALQRADERLRTRLADQRRAIARLSRQVRRTTENRR